MKSILVLFLITLSTDIAAQKLSGQKQKKKNSSKTETKKNSNNRQLPIIVNEPIPVQGWTKAKGRDFQVEMPTDWILDTNHRTREVFMILSPKLGELDSMQENVKFYVQDIRGMNVSSEKYLSTCINGNSKCRM